MESKDIKKFVVWGSDGDTLSVEEIISFDNTESFIVEILLHYIVLTENNETTIEDVTKIEDKDRLDKFAPSQYSQHILYTSDNIRDCLKIAPFVFNMKNFNI